MAKIHRVTPILGWANWKRRVVAASALIGFLLMTAAIAYIASPAVRQSFALASSMHPESYTELYLDNSTHLPTSAPAGKPRSFAFHISNHEGRQTTYHYLIVMVLGQQATAVSSGSLTLNDGAGLSETVSFTVPKPGLDPMIQVQLEGRPESVQFRTQS